MEKKSDHEFFKRILTAFLATILIFVLSVSLFCLWFIHETRKRELRNADSGLRQTTSQTTVSEANDSE